jgi:hypothetical protein
VILFVMAKEGEAFDSVVAEHFIALASAFNRMQRYIMAGCRKGLAHFHYMHGIGTVGRNDGR